MSTLAAAYPTSFRTQMWGIACAVAASALFGTLDTTSQLVGLAAPLLMVQWVRYTMQTAIGAALLAPLGRAGFRVHRPGLQLLRAALMICISALALISLRYVPVGDFTAIMMTIPVMVTLVSMVVLNEKVTPLRWVLVALSFVGTLVIVHPGREGFQLTWLLPFALAIIGTVFQVLTALMMRTENGTTTHFYSGLIGLLVTSISLPFVWQTLAWNVWQLLLIIAVTASTGHLLLIKAYERAGAPLATAYQYCQIGFAMLGGWLVFGLVPDGWSLIGVSLIAICGVLGVWLTIHEGKSSTAPQIMESD